MPRTIPDHELLSKTIDHLEDRGDDQDGLTLGRFMDLLEELSEGYRKTLSEKQRNWVNSVLDRFEPRSANLHSRGVVPTGRPVETPKVLLNLPKKPPPRPREDD